tara:strand:- start:346 stop:477 length:132 start_codon:yes stop_codon:yes gene_type:complete
VVVEAVLVVQQLQEEEADHQEDQAVVLVLQDLLVLQEMVTHLL